MHQEEGKGDQEKGKVHQEEGKKKKVHQALRKATLSELVELAELCPHICTIGYGLHWRSPRIVYVFDCTKLGSQAVIQSVLHFAQSRESAVTAQEAVLGLRLEDM